jgi:hypothetical protein
MSRAVSKLRHPSKTAAAARWYRLHHKHDQAAQLEHQLSEAHCCRICGRPLLTEESRRLGIGPDCLAKTKEDA